MQNQGSTFIPDVVSASTGPNPPKLPPSPEFIYKAHPERWTVLQGEVIADLAQIMFIAGLNNTGQVLRRGQPEKVTIGRARENALARGWVLIPFSSVPPSHTRPGQPRSYVYRPAGCPNTCLPIYTRAYAGSDKITCDEKRYVEFCQYQVSTGVIAPPEEHVLERMLESAQSRLSSAVDRARHSASGTIAVQAIEREVAAIEKELTRARRDLEPLEAEPFLPGGDDEDSEEEMETPPVHPVPKKPRARKTAPLEGFVSESAP